MSTPKTANTNIADPLELAVDEIHGMSAQYLSDFYFLYLADLDVMAVACERHERVRLWWNYTREHGSEYAKAVWQEVQARMDARAAASAIDGIGR